MKKEVKTAGKIIKEVRKTKHMTQMRLSELVGVSYQQIQKYEKGQNAISIDRLKQIANALEVPISLFFPSDRDSVAEAPAPYGKLTDEERQILQLFRNIKDKKAKQAVLALLKTLAAG